MKTTTGDPFARWWWPGQWLRIVWGVWVDQVWYWQNVRPRLRGRRQGWNFFVQGMLGSALVALILSAVFGSLLHLSGMPINWGALIRGVVITIVLILVMVLLFFIISPIVGGRVTVADILVLGITLEVMSAAGIGGSIGAGRGLMAVVEQNILWDIVGGLGIGLSIGISMAVIRGTTWTISDIVLTGIAAVAYGIASGKLLQSVILGISLCAGGYLGGRWATRQVSNRETRKQLAHPEKHT